MGWKAWAPLYLERLAYAVALELQTLRRVFVGVASSAYCRQSGQSTLASGYSGPATTRTRRLSIALAPAVFISHLQVLVA